MPIIRGSYLTLGIGFSHPQMRNLGPFPVASHPLPRAIAYLLHNRLYLAPSRWQVALKRAMALDLPDAEKCVVARRPLKNSRKSYKIKESLYENM